MPGRSVRRAVLPHADVMLAVGCRFTEVLTDWRRMPVPSRIVQIDLDPEQIGMNYPVVVGIVADAEAACRALFDGPAIIDDARTDSAGARSGTRPAPRGIPGPNG